MDAILTDIFKMKRRDFLLAMVAFYGKPWLATGCLLLLATLTASVFFDLRWAVVFLMLLFIVTPAMFAFLYYFHGLKPGCVANVIEHRITFEDTRLAVTLFKRVETDEGPEPASAQTATPPSQFLPASSFFVDYSSFLRFETGLNSVTFPLGDGRKGFLWVPASAFSAPGDFEKALGIVISGLRKPSAKQ